MDDTISPGKIDRYLSITDGALKKARIIAPQPSHLRDVAEDFFDMAKRYYEDAVHFHDMGDLVNAFAAVNYAHGWLDAGARLGLFDVDADSKLFTLAH